MTIYTITDLGILHGDFPVPECINASGAVAGYFGNGHAFRYGSTLERLPTPASIVLAEAHGISSSQPEYIAGLVVKGSSRKAVLWTDGVYTDLSSLVGGASEAWGVNGRGIVAGVADGQAFRFDATTQQVEKLQAPSGYDVYSCSINESGHVAGCTGSATGGGGLFIYDQTMHLLSTPGGVEWERSYINDADVIASNYGQPDDTSHVFTYDVKSNAFTDIHDAAFVGGSVVGGINNHGVVVGYCQDTYDSVIQAMIWTPSDGMRRLIDLVDMQSGWTFRNAEGINDAGQITGWGIHNGQARGFLLTPVGLTPVPHPRGQLTKELVEMVKEILVAGGGMGILLPSGDIIYPKDGPVDPDSPLQRIDAARSDAALGLAMQVLARRISDRSTRALAEQAAADIIRRAAASASSVSAGADRSNWLSRFVRHVADELER